MDVNNMPYMGKEQPMMGQPMPGQPMMGQPMPGQPMMGQPMPGQPMMGQPMPGQPMMGQPMMRRPMPKLIVEPMPRVTAGPALLECRNLSKAYVTGHFALNNLNLVLEKGHIIGLLGPNGSGKTTLIKLLNGLLVPTCGEVLINGQAPGPETKAIVSYLPERTYLEAQKDVKSLVQFFADFYPDFHPERAEAMLSSLGVPMDARLKTLSKGNKEKVQLILVMSRDAQLYVLDEPIAGVDPAARDYILKTILNNYNQNASIVICTHLIHDIEDILDEVVFIKNGSLVVQAPAERIRNELHTSVDQYFREVFAC